MHRKRLLYSVDQVCLQSLGRGESRLGWGAWGPFPGSGSWDFTLWSQAAAGILGSLPVTLGFGAQSKFLPEEVKVAARTHTDFQYDSDIKGICLCIRHTSTKLAFAFSSGRAFGNINGRGELDDIVPCSACGKTWAFSHRRRLHLFSAHKAQGDPGCAFLSILQQMLQRGEGWQGNRSAPP